MAFDDLPPPPAHLMALSQELEVRIFNTALGKITCSFLLFVMPPLFLLYRFCLIIITDEIRNVLFFLLLIFSEHCIVINAMHQLTFYLFIFMYLF